MKIRHLSAVILSLFPTVVFAATKTAIFAGGCFWCIEADFEKLPGVVNVVSGYDGGTHPNPSYELVSAGKTRYVESIRVQYDPKKVSYSQLLNHFWRHIDPTQANGQFCDKGPQYRSVIFYLNAEQKKLAEQSKQALKKHFETIHTEILPSTKFYPAEEYHQDYAKKNPVRYRFYRTTCGRDLQVKDVWQRVDS